MYSLNISTKHLQPPFRTIFHTHLLVTIHTMAPSGITKRSTSFSQLEIDNMLESIGIILPVGGTDWETVERQHETRWPGKRRTKESLKCKFQSLYRKKIPTSDLDCPPDVLTAKWIQEDIKVKIDMSEGESEDGDEGGGGDDDDDEIEIVMNDASSPSARALVVAEVLAEPEGDISVNGAPTVSAGPTINASIKRASRPRPKKRRKKCNLLNQVVTKRGKKNYGDDDEEDFSMNSYFKMMMVERQNERKEEKERRLDEVDQQRPREAQQERRMSQAANGSPE